jgi:hypothetical protein
VFRGPHAFGVLGALVAACAGRVEFDCDGDAAASDAGAPCVDFDGDGFLAGRDGGPCPDSEQRFEPSDCDDGKSGIHPRNVEWLDDGEDWDCDGLDGPELCLGDALDWVEDPPDSCASGNLVIQTLQTCNVCSGMSTYLLVRVAEVAAPWFRQAVLYVVADSEQVYRVDVPDFDRVSPVLAVPARWSVVAYLGADGCDDADRFVSRSTDHSSCTR